LRNVIIRRASPTYFDELSTSEFCCFLSVPEKQKATSQEFSFFVIGTDLEIRKFRLSRSVQIKKLKIFDYSYLLLLRYRNEEALVTRSRVLPRRASDGTSLYCFSTWNMFYCIVIPQERFAHARICLAFYLPLYRETKFLELEK
jgi:hypothetical protein